MGESKKERGEGRVGGSQERKREGWVGEGQKNQGGVGGLVMTSSKNRNKKIKKLKKIIKKLKK